MSFSNFATSQLLQKQKMKTGKNRVEFSISLENYSVSFQTRQEMKSTRVKSKHNHFQYSCPPRWYNCWKSPSSISIVFRTRSAKFTPIEDAIFLELVLFPEFPSNFLISSPVEFSPDVWSESFTVRHKQFLLCSCIYSWRSWGKCLLIEMVNLR